MDANGVENFCVKSLRIVVEYHQLDALHNILFVSALSISTIAEFLGSNLLHSQQPLNYVAPTG